MLVATAEPGLVIVYPRDDEEWEEGCVCECCPCNMHGCPVCVMAAPDTGPYGFRAPVVHGASTRAVIARSAADARNLRRRRLSLARDKQAAHRSARHAWRTWLHVGRYEEREPETRPLTGRDVA